jgi:hypothetical protein
MFQVLLKKTMNISHSVLTCFISQFIVAGCLTKMLPINGNGGFLLRKKYSSNIQYWYYSVLLNDY